MTTTKLATIALTLTLVASCARTGNPRGDVRLLTTHEVAGCFVPPPVPTRDEEGCREEPAAPALARSKMFHHLRYHQQFPVARTELLAALRRSAEMTADESTWIAGRLADHTFSSGAEVLGSLFPAAPAAALAQLTTAYAQR